MTIGESSLERMRYVVDDGIQLTDERKKDGKGEADTKDMMEVLNLQYMSPHPTFHHYTK